MAEKKVVKASSKPSYLDVTLGLARHARSISLTLVGNSVDPLASRVAEYETLGELAKSKGSVSLKGLAKALRLPLKQAMRSVEALRATGGLTVTGDAGGQSVIALTEKGEKGIEQLKRVLEKELPERFKTAGFDDKSFRRAANGLKLIARAVRRPAL